MYLLFNKYLTNAIMPTAQQKKGYKIKKILVLHMNIIYIIIVILILPLFLVHLVFL